MTGEEWLPVPGWTGYEASSLGRVRSFRSRREGRILTPTRNHQNGYLYVTARADDATPNNCSAPIHVLVTIAFHGARPDGAVVRHLDGDQTNNSSANLVWGTPAENSADRVLHGTLPPRLSLLRGHCFNGHPYTSKNTRLGTDGFFECRVCDREQIAARRHRRRLEIAATEVGRSA